MIKWINKNWKSIKIAFIQWIIILVILAVGTTYFTYRAFKRTEVKLEICQNNMEEITKQIKNSRIILELE